jgi:hypothetical protein
MEHHIVRRWINMDKIVIVNKHIGDGVFESIIEKSCTKWIIVKDCDLRIGLNTRYIRNIEQIGKQLRLSIHFTKTPVMIAFEKDEPVYASLKQFMINDISSTKFELEGNIDEASLDIIYDLEKRIPGLLGLTYEEALTIMDEVCKEIEQYEKQSEEIGIWNEPNISINDLNRLMRKWEEMYAS